MDDSYHYLQRRQLHGKHATSSTRVNGTSYSRPGTSCESKIGSLGSRPQPRLYVLSTSDENGATRIATLYKDHLGRNIEKNMGAQYMIDLAYTLSEKRTHLPWRFYAIADSIQELRQRLSDLPVKVIKSREATRLVYIFTGQGAQWYAMARELFLYPAFNRSIDAASQIFRNLGCRWSLRGEHC